MLIGLNKFLVKILSAFVIAALVLTGISITPAAADVGYATNWINASTGPNSSVQSHTIPNGTFSCGAGSNRLLVAVVTAEYGSSPGQEMLLTATKGAGVNFTEVVHSVDTGTPPAVGVWIGYLTEAQIAGNTDDIVITETVLPSNDDIWGGSDVHLACFSGVSQDNPIVSNGIDEENSGQTFVPSGSSWNFSVDAVNGGVVIYAGGLSNGTVTFNTPAGYTEAIDVDNTNGYRTTVGYNQAVGTGTESGIISWDDGGLNISVRYGFAAVSLNPAVPPAITSATSTTFTVQVMNSFTVTTTGDPAPSISYTGSLPTGVNLVDNGDGTATLSGTPALGTAGDYPITITASNGEDPDATQNFTLTVLGSGQGASVLPATGFPQGRVSILPPQPAQKAYVSTDMLLEIPAMNQQLTIVGVPQSAQSWDVTWLGNDAGYLAGSAYPTWVGNTVITGHIWDAFNRPGPFADLKTLKYGDQILIHAWGQVYTYEVRESMVVSPRNVGTVMQHEDLDWITLLSCENYDPSTDTYSFRRMVRAVLVSVK